MSETLRVGLLGLTHDHVWDNLPHLINHPDAEVVVAADTSEELVSKAVELTGCKASQSYADVLNDSSLDAVYIFASNRLGSELAIAAANKGLHVLIEKPMAASHAAATAMVQAADENKIRLMINWPFAWWPQLQHGLRLAADGAIGNIWQVKYRAAHQGPAELGCSKHFCDWLFDEGENGGGAMMDYCCYGCLLASVVMGQPQSVQGMSGRFVKESIDVEDNAIIVMKYENGMATAEASWTQIGKLTAYTTAIYGTSGTLMVEPRNGGRLLLATAESPTGEPVELPDSPAHLANSAAHFIHGIRSGEPFQSLCSHESAIMAQSVLEAGRDSAANGAMVSM